uniref:TIR domain-containing protein n=1 Tax=Neogobius melanostomus TaxID=47308 RepID=A0A8C6U691_9GOBI
MESLFSLLFLLLLPRPSWLYSLHNCTIESTDPWKINCNYYYKLSRIPPDIPKSVAYLSVYGTNIESICQGDFSGLTELQTLDLGGNHISQIEDAAFSHLSSLTELSLSTNSLKNLTDHMFTGLSNLTVLGLGFNKINHISGLAFAPLTKLLELDLWGNHLSSISDIVKVVSFCPLLKSLDLSGNPLTSIESEQFPFPFNITVLDLSWTPLSRFSLHSDVFPHLQTLHLASVYNDLQWNISDKAFLKSLMTLDLGFNSFSVKTCQLIFQSLDSLEKLVLNYVYPLDRGLLDMACGIQTLQSLDVYNSENHFINDSLFKLCSNLTELDLSLNHLTDVAPSSLQMLTRLSRLNFSINGLTEVPLTIRNMSSLTSLSFKSNSISKLRCLDFSGLHLLKILDLSYNNIRELNSCVFQDLQNLQELNIRKNLILKFDDSFGTTLPNLLFLDAADNNIKKLQKGVFRNMTHLTDLDLVSQFAPLMSMEKGSFDGLTDLRNLSISPFHISYSPPAGVGPQSSSRGRSQLQQVFNLPSLQTLRITVYKGSCISLTIDLLKGLDDLKMLSLKGCFIRALDTKMFHHTPRLINLEIRNIRKWTPVPELFQPLTVLQTLDLSENHLKSVDFLSEANLMQLQTLKLQNNDVSVINERVFEALPSLRYLDVSDNPFVCNCSNADFIDWVIWNRQVYVNGAYQYRCASLPSEQGALLLEFDYRWCWESVGFFCFICSSALVLLTLLLSFLHHFLRFHLQYSFYLLRAFLYHRQQRGQGCAEIYDAFVSYNVHDEEWVYRELLPELEGRQGWKLCLHHRDFEPGKAIMENIVDAIYSSRKTLCVISHQYLLSEWCSREIQMASFRLLDEQKDVLILLFLEELSSNQLSPFFRMRKLMRSRTYLSWSGARGHRGLFWERVRHALQSGAQLPTTHCRRPTDN